MEQDWETQAPEQSNDSLDEEWDVGIPPFTAHFRHFFAFLDQEKEEKTQQKKAPRQWRGVR